ncbi:MAG: DtxR family transcriptional regulator [Deltaproteobacteria bacterium]|nr:MAG: DtxR family transcriptional regulator [Deltaproteobacteria bacterium]
MRESKKGELRLSASLEDYLEAILVISKKHGAARSKEIMEHLHVSGPSVTEALQHLSQKKLVNYKPYEAITLTTRGKEVAEDVLNRHTILKDFFVDVLGIEPDIADEGACQMEHVTSSEIFERMVLYTKYLAEKERCALWCCEAAKSFKEYLRSKEHDPQR